MNTRIEVNGVAVDPAGWDSPEQAAVHELLRQRALAAGLLGPEDDDVQEAMEQLLQREVSVPEPSTAECRRWYDAHAGDWRSGELVHVRHILFQVTPRAPVPAIRRLGEKTLAELQKQPEHFAERARALSNCPSRTLGGSLGQVGRGDTAPEFERAVFADVTLGVLPRLVRTRYGFHIVAVDQRISGEPLPFEAVRQQVADRLRLHSQERALAQYIQLLVHDATVDGVALLAAGSPLVQ